VSEFVLSVPLRALRKRVESLQPDGSHERLAGAPGQAALGEGDRDLVRGAGDGVGVRKVDVQLGVGLARRARSLGVTGRTGVVGHGLGLLPRLAPGLLGGVERCRRWAYTLAGRIGEGLPLLELAVAQAASMGLMYGHSLWVSLLGEGYLLAGRLEEAQARPTEALSFARTHHERAYEATALRLLGEIHVHRQPPAIEAAEECYNRAFALADELRMRPLVAHCHLGLGKLYQRTDKREQAREHLATATTMYREMGMTYWLEKAEVELAEP
jgi:tetratricopeptide (TPR) repeat protein